MNKPSPIIKYSLMGMACLGIFQTKQLTQYVDARIQELPVYGKQVQTQTNEPKKVQANPDLVRSLVPIFVENTGKDSKLTQNNPSVKSVDSVFTPPVDAAKPAVPKEVDKAQVVNQELAKKEAVYSQVFNLIVNATSKNSAIINGTAYTLHEPIYYAGLKVGTLDAVTPTYVIVKTSLKPVKVYIAN